MYTSLVARVFSYCFMDAGKSAFLVSCCYSALSRGRGGVCVCVCGGGLCTCGRRSRHVCLVTVCNPTRRKRSPTKRHTHTQHTQQQQQQQSSGAGGHLPGRAKQNNKKEDVRPPTAAGTRVRMPTKYTPNTHLHAEKASRHACESKENINTKQNKTVSHVRCGLGMEIEGSRP